MRRTKRGLIQEVDNKERNLGSAIKYLAVWVERNGVEFCLLFTEHEINVAKERSEKNEEDIPKKSFLTDLTD